MNVRPPSGPTEFRDALRMKHESWRAAYADVLPSDVLAGLSVPDGETLREQYEEWQADGLLLVAVDDGVVGLADVGVTETKPFARDGDAELRALYAAPDRWRTGVGSALLDDVLRRLGDDHDRLVLEAFAANDVGRSFYRKRGFEKVDESSVEIGNESYPTAVYAKRL